MKKIYLSTLLLFLSYSIACSQAPGSGYALDFNTSTDYVSIPNNAALNPTNALTLEAWIKADSWSVNSWGNVIISKDVWGAGEAGYTLRCGANGTLSFNIGTTTSWKEAISTPQMALNTWYHVAGTFDGTTLKCYINGQLAGTFSYSGVMLASTYALTVGRITYTAGGTRNFDGKIDEVRVWNTALSQATIQSYMTKKVTPSHPNYGALVTYLKMDEGTGTTTVDSSPMAFTGTLYGTTWGLSAAAIGDSNTVVYGAPTGATVSNPDGSSFTAMISSGNPAGLHVYAIHQTPNAVAENMSGSLETTHTFGVFLVGGTAPTYSLRYNYTGVTGLAASGQEQNIRLAKRADNTGTLWSRITTQFGTDSLNNLVVKCGLSGRQEFACGFDSTRFGISNSTICDGDTLLYFGQPLTTAGLYTHTTTLPNGCDSIEGIQLTVIPAVNGVDSVTICQGDTLFFAGQALTATGPYVGVFTAASGCDSIVRLTLRVTPAPVTTISDTICDGDTYMLGSQMLTQAGTYSETFAAWNGCDSIVTLNLAIHPVDTSVTVSGNTLTANLVSNTYQWLSCDNGFGVIPGQTSQSFTAGADGSYAVIVSDGVCSDTSGCHFVLAIGVKDGLNGLIRISPNPTTAAIRLERMDGEAIGSIRLCDLSGRVIRLLDAHQNSNVALDLSALEAGIYFLHCESDGRTDVLKVCKQ